MAMESSRGLDSPDRLEALEREVRRLSRQKHLAVVFCVVILLFVLTKDVALGTRPKTVRTDMVITERLIIQRQGEDPSIVLAHEPNGTPVFRFYDSKKKNRLAIGMTEDDNVS